MRDGFVVGGINPVTFAARNFWRRRGAREAHTLHGSARSAQRSLRRKGLLPAGLRRFGLGALLLVGRSPTLGDVPSSRLSPKPKATQRTSPYLCLRPLSLATGNFRSFC